MNGHNIMKKIILCVVAALIVVFGTSMWYENQRSAADGSCNIKAAVLGGSDRADEVYNRLCNGIMANIDVEKINSGTDIDDFDIVYITDTALLDAAAAESYVYGGGTVVLDNSVMESFSNEFLGASETVKIEGMPSELSYAEPPENMRGISELIYDYMSVFKDYEALAGYAKRDYGVGVIPDTAEAIASYNGAAIFARNKYGSGNVFITNPIISGDYTAACFGDDPDLEPFAFSTAAAHTLLLGYYAEYVSKIKYGFAVERTFGAFGTNTAAWELHYEDITGIKHNALETFSYLCMKNLQMPSYTLARNLYVWFNRTESLTWLKYKDGKITPDPYEGVYCSGRHIVSSGKWLTLDHYDDTDSYFDDNAEYTKRLYPCVIDWNDDGLPDFICGSADGSFYYFEATGSGESYETGISTVLTDKDGFMLNVGGYSSPVVFDIDGDGRGELVSGSESGTIFMFDTLKTDDDPQSKAFEYSGVVLETGLTDSMIDVGDLNGDGIVDMAVGSRYGEMRVYYGYSEDGWATKYGDYVAVDTGESRIAPCIYGGELYGGTQEGYIAHYSYDGSGYIRDGYLKCDEISRRGDDRITIGTNAVPRFADMDGDGDDDLVCGSLEYGMAYPIDSEYFPYENELRDQLEFCRKNNIYMGVHNFTHKYATAEQSARELEYQRSAFDKYGISFGGSGVNQHTWFTSDATFAAQRESGLLWNSGFTPPNSGQVPQMSAENALPMPIYDSENDFLLMQVCNTPHGNGAYSFLTVKYGMPLLFYNHCDYIYNDEQEREQEEAIDKAAKITDEYNYMFVREDQMARSVAASYNTDIKTESDGGDIIISGSERDMSRALYNKNNSDCVGVKVVFADGVDAEEYGTNSPVWDIRDNAVYVALTDTVRISRDLHGGELVISGINAPAHVKSADGKATITFAEGGMMSVRVKGSVSEFTPGWIITKNGGDTILTKYGDASRLKIKK